MADIQKELAIRLAWYADRYGEIPQHDQIRLWRAATLGHKDKDMERVVALADEILEWLQSM